jgi:hypothetical protein
MLPMPASPDSGTVGLIVKAFDLFVYPTLKYFIYLSIYLSIWLYILCGPRALFSFLIYTQLIGLLGR